MRRALLAAILAILFSGMAFAATFVEDFSIDLSHWTNVSGSFTISGSGRLNAVTLVAHNAMYHNTPVAADQWIQWELTTVTNTDNGFAGYVRADDTYSGYQCFSFTLSGAEAVAIYELDAGSFNLLTTDTFIWSPGDIGYCEVIGQNITFNVNGNTVLTTSDATYTSGNVGLELYAQVADAVEIDNVSGGDFATTTIRHSPIIPMTKMKLLFTFILSLFLFSEAGAATKYVRKTGADGARTCTNTGADACLTINYALTKMSGGDTLEIGAGDYDESISETSPPGRMVLPPQFKLLLDRRSG